MYPEKYLTLSNVSVMTLNIFGFNSSIKALLRNMGVFRETLKKTLNQLFFSTTITVSFLRLAPMSLSPFNGPHVNNFEMRRAITQCESVLILPPSVPTASEALTLFLQAAHVQSLLAACVFI